MTIGEIQAGIEITREQGAPKADALEQWLAQVSATFNGVPMDAPAFRDWARLIHHASDTFCEHSMIAATARVHQLTVVTRVVDDFVSFGVPVLNPFLASRNLRPTTWSPASLDHELPAAAWASHAVADGRSAQGVVCKQVAEPSSRLSSPLTSRHHKCGLSVRQRGTGLRLQHRSH